MLLVYFADHFSDFLVEWTEFLTIKLLKVHCQHEVFVEIPVPWLVQEVIAKHICIVLEFVGDDSPVCCKFILNAVRIVPEVSPRRCYLG